jgi:predicted DNA-binding protein
MAPKRKVGRPPSERPAVRCSISFPPEIYEALEVLAKQKKVSIAWVVRDSVERYVADHWPRLAKET